MELIQINNNVHIIIIHALDAQKCHIPHQQQQWLLNFIILLCCYINIVYPCYSVKWAFKLSLGTGVRSKYVCQTIDMGKCLKIMETSTKLKNSLNLKLQPCVLLIPPKIFKISSPPPERPPISPSTPVIYRTPPHPACPCQLMD